MCVHGDICKRDNLKFDFCVYDVVTLKNGIRAIITNYGVYNNQYWCDVPESSKCGSSGWFWYDNSNVSKNVIVDKVYDVKIINDIRRKYLAKLLERKIDFNHNSYEFNAEIDRITKLVEKDQE